MSIVDLEADSVAERGAIVLRVIKRDGRTLPFDERRIAVALTKAYAAVHGEIDRSHERSVDALVALVVADLEARAPAAVKIYEIQAAVEHALLDAGERAVARAYIDYRVERDLARSEAIDLNHSIHRLLDKDSAVVHENANKDADVFNTQRDLTAGAVGKAIGLRMLPDHVANAHAKGDLHYHDLDYHPYAPMTNCCLIDFRTMLADGFRMSSGDMNSGVPSTSFSLPVVSPPFPARYSRTRPKSSTFTLSGSPPRSVRNTFAGLMSR